MTVSLLHREGVPILLVNGRPKAPMLFWGYHTPRPFAVGREWRRCSFHFTSPVDDPEATFCIYLALSTGSFWLDDVEIVESAPEGGPGRNFFLGGDFEGGEAQRDKFWNFFVGHGARASWALDCKEARSGRCSLRVEVERGSSMDWHVHLYTKNLPIKKGRRYTISFWAKCDRDSWPITALVMRLEGVAGYNPYRVYAVSNDSFTATVRIMAEYGFHLYSVPLPLPWPRPGEEPDFAEVDQIIAKIVDADPMALILPRISVEPPRWWAKEHPGEMLWWQNRKFDRWVSVASKLWLEEATRNLRRLVHHLESKWGRHILGYHPSAQNTNEWFYPIWYHEEWGLMNFEPAFERGWREWLKERYKTICALNALWGTSYESFDQIRLPSVEERKSSTLGVFRHPKRERRMLDFTLYQNEAMARALDRVARAVKQACKGRKLVYAFYGYTFELSGCRYGIAPTGHLRLGWLLRQGSVDVFCAPLSYFDRQVGGCGTVMGPANSVALHGRAWLNEDDTRTHLSAPNAGFGRTSTPEETKWVHTRNFAQALALRAHMWFMDLFASGWLLDSGIWSHLARLRRLYEQLYAQPRRPIHEVAVLVDEDSLLALRYGVELSRPLLYEARFDLHRMGTTPSFWLLSDFVEGRVPRHKVYIFLNAFWLTRGERREIRERLEGSGAVAVWFYAPGFLGEDDASTRFMEELTGFRFRRLEGPRSMRVELKGDSPLLEGIRGEEIGPNVKIEPVFFVVPEGGVQILGRYIEGGEPAVAMREVEGFTSVFVGTLRVPARFLFNLAKSAGAHLYADPGDVVYTDGVVLSITASSEGVKTIRLPRPSKVTDALTEEVVIERGDTFQLHLRRGETRIFVVTSAPRKEEQPTKVSRAS